MSDNARPARRRRRKRDPCSAHRRGGAHCGASAIPGGTVCLAHGGSAPQVRIKAGRVVRQERIFEALLELQKHDPVSARWYHANDRVITAERDLDQYESDLDLVALMEMELTDPSGPEIRAWLLEVALGRLAGRPWTSPLRVKAMEGPRS